MGTNPNPESRRRGEARGISLPRRTSPRLVRDLAVDDRPDRLGRQEYGGILGIERIAVEDREVGAIVGKHPPALPLREGREGGPRGEGSEGLARRERRRGAEGRRLRVVEGRRATAAKNPNFGSCNSTGKSLPNASGTPRSNIFFQAYAPPSSRRRCAPAPRGRRRSRGSAASTRSIPTIGSARNRRGATTWQCSTRQRSAARFSAGSAASAFFVAIEDDPVPAVADRVGAICSPRARRPPRSRRAPRPESPTIRYCWDRRSRARGAPRRASRARRRRRPSRRAARSRFPFRGRAGIALALAIP